MTFDFTLLFNSFLDVADTPIESDASSSEFVFSEREYILQQSFLESKNSSEHVKHRAADWILTAWEKGYIKNAK